MLTKFKMWKLIFNAFSLLSFVNYSAVATPAIKPNSMRGIIFPTIERHDDCFLDARHTFKGTCKKLADCPKALERWNTQNERPQTCYFNKFDHVVCCEADSAPIIEEISEEPISFRVQRRSELECDDYFGFKIQVVHGTPTAPKEFPYMAALGWPSNFDNSTIYRCGGVLISATFVMTAAHCTEMGGDLPSAVRIGGVNLTDATVTDVKIKRVIVHPEYSFTSTYNDIALIELEQPVSETPACVWSSNDVDHNNVTAIGYGQIRFAGVSSSQLLKASLFLVSNNICSQFYRPDELRLQKGIESTHICAGDPEHLRDTCQGDSGGPIIIKVERDNIRSYVVGITSFGKGCAGEPPSIYTRTSSYIDWIENIVWPLPNRK